MQSSLQQLRKYFRLEHEKGYDNTTIIGGLSRMLESWEGSARADSLNEEVIQAVLQRLRSYDSLSPASRADVLKGLWKRIAETYPEAAQKQSAGEAAPARHHPHPEHPGDLPEPLASPRQEQEGAAPAPAEKAEAPTHASQPGRPPRASSEGVSAGVPGAKTSAAPAALNAPLTVLQGVGASNASLLAKLGLHTLGDLLYYFPFRYEDYTQLKPINEILYGNQLTVIGRVESVHTRPMHGGKQQLVEALLSDGTGALRLTWFNQPWMANRLHVGDQISTSGIIGQHLGRLVMKNPNFEPVDMEYINTNRIVPIYPLTQGLNQTKLRRVIRPVVSYWSGQVAEALPESVRQSAGLLPIGAAIQNAHFPDSQELLAKARHRLAFDEIFYLQMGVLRQKRDWQAVEARRFEAADDWLEARLAALPFQLTGAQQRVLGELRADLASGRPMNRLIQGDVGSGKTVVAALAAGIVALGSGQSAIMAPTAILAGQHYNSFLSLLAGEGGPLQPEQIRLLVSDTPEAEKEQVRSGLVEGSIRIVIGTHALLEGPVVFQDLEFAVIDEQHRFGVEQRAALRQKAVSPHLLVMTATPIPRSLALTVHGDLDLSVMDEMPPGRQPVATYVLRPQERERAYTLVRSQVAAGRQAFIIYPLIEESGKIEAPAAVDDYDKLSNAIFPDLKLGLLHGRMRPDEKDAAMLKFRDREYDILVSTTVVEVGVDIPNATVMLIEGADRFGLAQLHQLRGRVGRGQAASCCLLIPTHEEAVENGRLQAMTESNDGFVLAERDLQQRGPGEFLGTRQSGYGSGLRMASLTDLALIEKARSQAQALFEDDPELSQPQHALLAEALERYWKAGPGDVS